MITTPAATQHAIVVAPVVVLVDARPRAHVTVVAPVATAIQVEAIRAHAKQS